MLPQWEENLLTADVSHKTAAITGAAGGIGSAIADVFARNGARLFLMDQKKEALERVAEHCRTFTEKVSTHCEDLTIPGAPEQAAKKCQEICDGTSVVLINNAAIGGGGLLQTNAEEWDSTMRVNIRMPFLLSRAFASAIMIPGGGGVILNMSSQTGVIALDEQGVYGISKAAMMALTRAIAYEWGQYGIRSMALAPTVVETPFALSYWHGETAERHRSQIPAGRFGQPWEVAAACLYLASDAAGLLDGTNLMLDGGYTIR